MGDDDRKRGGLGQWLGCAGAILVLGPVLSAGALSFVGPPSWETVVFWLGGLTILGAAIWSPWRASRVGDARWAIGIGALIMLAPVAYRLADAGQSTTITAYTGPGYGAGRWIDRVVPERDVAIGGSALLVAAGAMGPDDEGLLDALRSGYDRMRLAEGAVPSAVISTFVLGQSDVEHSVLRIVPTGQYEPPSAVVVFMHGFAGNVTVECWQVAQAANPVGLDIVCPSTDWRARWIEPSGRNTVETTIAELRAAGVDRVYLAGLSAGGIGASRMAASLEIDGLILISGVSARARPTRVPTLILQGGRDRGTPPAPARAYARALGPRRAQYVEVEDANHWLILSHHELVTQTIREWLAEREGLGAVHRAR